MATYPTTGFTPTIDELTKARNEVKACIEIIRDARANGNSQMASHWECRLITARAKYKSLLKGEFESGRDGDVLAIRRRVKELRFLLNGKKRDIAKTTKLSMIVMMQKDVQGYEAEISRLTALLPTGFGFRDMVDRHMNSQKGA